MKIRLETCEETGESSPEGRICVQRFVDHVFMRQICTETVLGEVEDQVLGFKNKPSLQSVAALVHFHVIVLGASKDMLEKWTNGDIPVYLREN